MKICVIGWYGTETLGDRAILLGIFEAYTRLCADVCFRIGSLFPCVTERTVQYDSPIYNQISPDLSVSIFDSRDSRNLRQEINSCDHVVIGGGPLMDLAELQILSFAFRYARRKRKRTIIFGCGVGPLTNRCCEKNVIDILKHCNLGIFRDPISLSKAKNLLGGEADHFMHLHDPAIIPIGRFLSTRPVRRGSGACINFREPPTSIYGKPLYDESDFVDLIGRLKERFGSVELIPMHTYYTGGDDRLYLSELQHSGAYDNVSVIHPPMNVFELFQKFYDCAACAGMRYHSVVFQTLLNGNNAILDYTGGVGKIQGFIEALGASDFYEPRTVHLFEASGEEPRKQNSRIVAELATGTGYICPGNLFEDIAEQYRTRLSGLA